jgi:signal transduction histidine kinase
MGESPWIWAPHGILVNLLGAAWSGNGKPYYDLRDQPESDDTSQILSYVPSMSSKSKAQLVFASALALLVLSGAAAAITILRLANSANWVAHSYDVQVTIGEIDSDLATADRARLGYVNSGDDAYLDQYDEANGNASADLLRLRELTKDNPTQERLSKQMNDLANERMDVLKGSIDLARSGDSDEKAQAGFSRDNVNVASRIVRVMQEMRSGEEGLLGARRQLSGNLFAIVVCIVFAAFILSGLLFWLHYLLLSRELRERERAEQSALESQTSARRLSARIMQLQDEERRKFSRELHDSLGQYLAAVKMNLSALAREDEGLGEALLETLGYVDQSIAETRTLSYLLHPPLLDEAGFPYAARWYVEGFAQRSGIQVQVDIPERVERLGRPAELVLFRVLQESLTNIHRHSQSSKAEVSLRAVSGGVVLRVRDFGKGMPSDLVERARADGSQLGVGLAGMRERVREVGGRFEVRSDGTGTVVIATVPLTPQEQVNADKETTGPEK